MPRPNKRRRETPAKGELPALTRSIAENLDMALGDEDQVRRDCDRIRQLLAIDARDADYRLLAGLARLLPDRFGKLADLVFALVLEAAATAPRPWPLLAPLLHCEDEASRLKVLTRVKELVDAGKMPVDRRLLCALAELLELDTSEDDAAILEPIAAIVWLRYPQDGDGGIMKLFRSDRDPRLRRLAARILDRDGQPVAEAFAQRFLGRKVHSVLAPYLSYTRATHSDLLLLAGSKQVDATAVSLRAAESISGRPVLRQVIAALGWARVNRGIEARRYRSVSIAGSPPLPLRPAAAKLLLSRGAASPVEDVLLFVAQGESAPAPSAAVATQDPVSRFRSYNLAHAELLRLILDVAALDTDKVQRILEYLDAIVVDFVALFAEMADECEILPGLYRDLKAKVLVALDAEPRDAPLGAEITRLVQMFEDPKNLGEVRTLHGLKRYLHQRGLKLGFGLVDTTRTPNRSIDLVALGPDGQPELIKTLRYAEFEVEAEAKAADAIPYPFRILVDAFVAQLLQGQTRFPDVDAYSFGNEVHYYLAFRNHPVFIRIDYSPPQRGGMIDLEYFGVSNYELDSHPNLSLDAIRHVFRELGFEVKRDVTKLHVRYDKERSLELGDLCEKAESLFRLAPYLMDLDWIVSTLELADKARRELIAAWATRFRQTGILPLTKIVTPDGLGIAAQRIRQPEGVKLLRWDGRGQYRDLYTSIPKTSILDPLQNAFADLGLAPPALPQPAPRRQPCPLALLSACWRALDDAEGRGQLETVGDSYRGADPQRLRQEHEASRFAELLGAGGPPARGAVAVAGILSHLEHCLELHPTGSVGGLEVTRASLSLRGARLAVFAARDSHGVIRLGMFAEGGALVARRRRKNDAWRSNGSTDAARLWHLLRASNYVTAEAASPIAHVDVELAELRDLAGQSPSPSASRPPGDERSLSGLRAAPGRAVGRALFGTEGREPEDLRGAILVMRDVRPTDIQFLSQAAGIVSTGGALLSHAALLALQFGKPALVVSAQWLGGGERSHALQYHANLYDEVEEEHCGYAVRLRQSMRELTLQLQEGDLLILDAGGAALRVLGQERDALALHEGFRLLAEASRQHRHASAAPELMATRAQGLRARHQIEKVLGRLADPALAGYAVEEIVLGTVIAEDSLADRSRLLDCLRANSTVGATALAYLQGLAARLEDAYVLAHREAAQLIPGSRFLHEILDLRLRVGERWKTLHKVRDTLADCGMSPADAALPPPEPIDALARGRLTELVAELEEQLVRAEDGPSRGRHLLRRIDRIRAVLDPAAVPGSRVAALGLQLAKEDRKAAARLADRYTLFPSECGFAAAERVGWKAANLAEIEKMAGAETTPPWFAVTSRAFAVMLAQAAPRLAHDPGDAGDGTLRSAIEAILTHHELDAAEQSRRIEALWRQAVLPEDLDRDLRAAWSRLRSTCPGDEEPFFAVRSSSSEEDTEAAARAGEFDTFLFVRGVDSVLDHVKLAWSGLWTERALYHRRQTGELLSAPSGGVIVQRMLAARVSGVLQTVNVAGGGLRELLVSAGLGLGEGIVSGRVAADTITVVKEEPGREGPLRFQYMTQDKPEQVVFDSKRGSGTRVVETLYHQRLRPALEYIELKELVDRARDLEAAYGYPLDIEFAIEEARLWILQARPIPTFLETLNRTLQSLPLAQTPPAALVELHRGDAP